ncbi:hypothetical protein G5B30_12295 [Sphingobacterium sp. SGG-5]|uniref:hypothetical protein n=1 Tax=Sphingobacterium sp. SGG-5 TaxID=2710881 RepID=UPI0013EB23E4|nr:hypothetical protein [Sphingobacterium sp. SGG-5]NGM62695.1 hypothetical protein [Sphingobacterium sp. SGG-5]
MSLDNFYSLRSDFLVVGLTGRSGGGCDNICEFLKSDNNPFTNDGFKVPKNLHINEIQKFTICKNLLTDSSNEWRKFSTVKYRDVLLLFFFEELYKSTSYNFQTLTYEILEKTFNSMYNPCTVVTRRLGQEEPSDNVVGKICYYLNRNNDLLNNLVSLFNPLRSTFAIGSFSEEEVFKHIEYLNKLFFESFSHFSKGLFDIIDKIDPIARQLFLQDIACNLRSSGKIYYKEDIDHKSEAEYIFTVAIAIKNLIKINRKVLGYSRVVIDSLKNSLEINFFRERYSGFYLIASRKDEELSRSYLKNKIAKMGFEGEKADDILKKIKLIDEAHYQIKDFKIGKFTTPDVENCIQKADYYIYADDNSSNEEEYNPTKFQYLSLELQLLKFLALVQKPGIVTASAIERSMQLAFSSKYNSGCISRQVGAVVTDINYSVKSVGWNEVPQGQTPCSLRNLKELVNEEAPSVYSEYEKQGGDYSGKQFKAKVKETLISAYGEESNFFNNLNGHNCPYCFKDFHNAYEGKENQVHTRSLHAEENAMLQISKFGGQGLSGGILFTTASPCELCSKKAFQLGIKKVFYIDPYPGIARQQILKAGNNKDSNPTLYMFQGAVGRGYFKLYEPYMSIKDETYIRTGIKPKFSEDKFFKDMKNQLLSKFPDNVSIEKMSTFDELMDIIQKGLEN